MSVDSSDFWRSSCRRRHKGWRSLQCQWRLPLLQRSCGLKCAASNVLTWPHSAVHEPPKHKYIQTRAGGEANLNPNCMSAREDGRARL